MNTHRTHHPDRELGTVWYVVPLVWVLAAVVVFVLLSLRPQLFAQEAPARADTVPAASYVSSDPSLPSAGDVFKDGASYETAQHVDTF